MEVIAQLGKMKKLWVLVVGILVVGLVIAGLGVVVNNKEVDYLNSTQKTTLAEVGINQWSYEDYNNTDYVKRCLISSSEFKLPCSEKMETYWENCTAYNLTYKVYNTTEKSENKSCSPEEWITNQCPDIEKDITHNDSIVGECLIWSKVYYSPQEMEDKLDAWMEGRMKGIADVIEKRENEATLHLAKEGNVTIKK